LNGSEGKAQANFLAHGVRFRLAKMVFKDPFAIERFDDREDYGEDRFVIIGKADGNVLLFVAYTERDERIRIFSAEGQPRMSKKTTSSKTRRPMTLKAIEAAARADRDAQPLTYDDRKRMKRTPQAKIIRRALALTQEEFAVRYHIPLGTLRDWEQGRAEPDQATKAYLRVIAREPERVERVLNAGTRTAATSER
jgi:putative transcriptional regulator